ncbi:hypothetical protein ACQJBY_003457 [Aegilops geniculata]
MALLKNNAGVLCLAALLVISATFLSCDASYGIRDGEGFNKFCVGWEQGCKDPVNGIPSQCQIYCRDNGFVLEKGKCAPDNGKPNRMCCCYK